MTVAGLASPDHRDRLNRPEPSWRREARLAAIDWLATHPMPSRHDEPWHYAPVEELTDLLREAAPARATYGLARGQVDVMAGDHGGPRLVFVNGRFARDASSVGDRDGLTAVALSDLGGSTTRGPAVEPDRLDGFVAINALDGDDGAVITVTADVSTPIHVVHVATPELDSCLLTHPSAVVRIGPGASATVVESFVGFTGRALTNASTVIDVEDGGALAYHRVQTEAPDASHVGHVRIRAGQSSAVRCASFSLGARLSRTAFDVTLGDGAHVDVDGLYLPSEGRRTDQMVSVEHVGSHSRSRQRFKGVIDDRARGSFTGHVVVRPGVEGIVADQTNHSILLSRTAESDSRPWLEILADDVRCTHGATVGRLDDEALFYLRSRGIPAPDARRLLIEGFVREIVEDVAIESLQDHIHRRIQALQLRLGDEP